MQDVRWQLYNEDMDYYDIYGNKYTKERFIEKYPLVLVTKMLVKTDYNIIIDVKPLTELKAKYKVEYNDNIDYTLAEINQKELEAETESTPLERIASSLEYIFLYLYRKEQTNELSQNQKEL